MHLLLWVETTSVELQIDQVITYFHMTYTTLCCAALFRSFRGYTLAVVCPPCCLVLKWEILGLWQSVRLTLQHMYLTTRDSQSQLCSRLLKEVANALLRYVKSKGLGLKQRRSNISSHLGCLGIKRALLYHRSSEHKQHFTCFACRRQRP